MHAGEVGGAQGHADLVAAQPRPAPPRGARRNM
jgi:hypothetical protein